MKKIIYIIGSALLCLVACNQGVTPELATLPAPEDGTMARVTFTLSIPETPLYAIETRADLPDQPTIADGDVYVAVFGGGDNAKLGGQLQHFLKATLVDPVKFENDPEPPIDHDLTNVEDDVTVLYKYEYEVLLPLSNEPLTLDFMVGACDMDGNPYTLDNPLPIEYEKDVMPLLVSKDGEPAYWQRVRIPGVYPKPKADGSGYEVTQYFDEEGELLPESAQDYIADEIPELKDLQLVRNFAKITYKADPNAAFTLKSFMLIDTPVYGSLAPYSSADGYNTLYTGLGTDATQNAIDVLTSSYKGYILSQDLSEGLGDDDDWLDPETGFGYMYERTIPSVSTSYAESGAILEIEWTNGAPDASSATDKTRFYKVAFVDENGYIPILRNIQYTFVVKDITADQHPKTAAAAYAGGFLGDVSANIATAMLDEITNNKSRIVVSEMSKTAIGDGKSFDIDFYFYPVASNPEVVVTDGKASVAAGKNVTIDISGPLADGSYDQAISSISEVTVTQKSDGTDDHGTITVTLNNSVTGKVQKGKVRITGQVEGQRALYREVEFTVMEQQSLVGSTVTGGTSDSRNQDVTIMLKLPEELPRDIFPLQIKIEAEKNSLTSVPYKDTANPENNVSALPVKYGESAYNGKNNYYFVKTITFDEYATLNGMTYDYKTEFPCYFKTRLESGNGTKIMIQDIDEEYFENEEIELKYN